MSATEQTIKRTMQRPVSNLIIACLFALIPLSHAFAPTSTITIPNLVFIAGLPILIIERSTFPKKSTSAFLYIFIPLLIYSLSLSIFYSQDYFNSTSINHYCAVGFIAVFAFISSTHLTCHSRRAAITKGLEFALASTSLLIIAEVALGITASITLGDLLPRPSVPELNSYYFGVLRRPRGFAEEPGHMAIFFEFAIPTYLYFCRRNAKSISILVASCIAWIALLSTASIIGLAFTTFIYLFLKLLHRTKPSFSRKTVLTASLWGVFICSFLLTFPSILKPNLETPSIEPIEAKLERFISSMSSNSTNSSDGRANRYKAAYEIVSNHPFGIGWGTAAGTTGQYKGIWLQPGFISLPLEIIVSFGIIGAILITLLISPIIHKAATSPPTPLLFSTIWVGFHFLFISNYWLPWPWLAYGLLLNSQNITRK